MFATSLLDMRYEIQATLSKGSTSNTKLAKDLTSQTSVAVKIFKEGSSEFTSKNKIQITREMQILQDLTHPNIVPIQVVNTTGATYFRKHGKEPYQCMYIVSELCKYGTLLDILGTQEMDERMVRYFFRQLMDALEFCHNNRICNIDLKSENVLFDHEGILKISGFCYASVIEDETQQERPRSRIEYFLPPELYEHKTCLGTQHDLYSAGILLFLMIARQQPFTRPNTRMDPIYASFYEENERYWNRLTNKLGPKNTPNYRQLMHMMLAYSPSQRLSIQEIRAHEWFQGEQAGPEEVTAFFSRIEEKSAENLQRAKRKAEEYKNRPNRF